MGFISRLLGGNDDEVSSTAQHANRDGSERTNASGDAAVLDFLVAEVVAILTQRGNALTSEDIDVDADIYSSGYIDSMTVSDLLVRAEKRYGLDLPDHIIGGPASTLKALADHISAKLSAG